jgi:hypothetical protein
MAFVTLALSDDLGNRPRMVFTHAVMDQCAHCQVVDLFETQMDGVAHALLPTGPGFRTDD